MVKPTTAELEQQLETSEKQRAAAVKAHEKASADLATVTGQRDEAAASVKGLTAQNKAQAEEIRVLSNSLRAYKSSATRARNEAHVLQGKKPPQARAVTELPASADDAERRAAGERFEKAIYGGPTTLVFSDGKREIRELAPLIVDGGAWRSSARGHLLDHEPLLEPGEMAKPLVEIAGFGLLDEAGRQVGWCPLPEPIVVPRNGRVQVPANTIRFAF